MNNDEIDEFETFNWELKPPYHKFVWAAIRSVGWYIVGATVILVYTWPYISKMWKNWRKKVDEREYDAKYHKNVDLSSELLLATQLAREKMQEKYLRDREIALQKEEERKARKREEVLRLESQASSGYRLNDDLSESSKSSYKKDFNPLMGNSGGGRYVAPKRSCCKKGGCG